MIFALSTIATICSIGGNLLVNLRKRQGFIVWLISNILWITVNIIGPVNVPQIVMFSVYTVLNIHGLISWRKKSNKHR